MKRTVIAMAAALSLALTSGAAASDRDFADIYTDCGLGALIAPNNDVVAVITNVTWDLGTTAISSDMSSPDTCKGGGGMAGVFIHDTYASLEQDLSQGNGEHLTALLTIAGCSAAAQDQISSALRSDFSELVAADGYSDQSRYESAENLYNAFTTRISSDFSQVCSL